MSPNTACINETETDEFGFVEHKTPVSKENPLRQVYREDISATLNYVSVFDLHDNDESTPLNSDYQGLEDEIEHLHDSDNIELFNPIEDVNEQRITLLARKYADKDMSIEDAARLEILTQKFRNVMPAITEVDIEIMESFSNQLKQGFELSERLKEKYK